MGEMVQAVLPGLWEPQVRTHLTQPPAEVPMFLSSALDAFLCRTVPGSQRDCSTMSTPSWSPRVPPVPLPRPRSLLFLEPASCSSACVPLPLLGIW